MARNVSNETRLKLSRALQRHWEERRQRKLVAPEPRKLTTKPALRGSAILVLTGTPTAQAQAMRLLKCVHGLGVSVAVFGELAS